VILQIEKRHAPYVLTKPIHPSQQEMKEDESGLLIRLDVLLNFELEREILGFGECLKVLAPRDLQMRIKKRLRVAAARYEEKKEGRARSCQSGTY